MYVFLTTIAAILIMVAWVLTIWWIITKIRRKPKIMFGLPFGRVTLLCWIIAIALSAGSTFTSEGKKITAQESRAESISKSMSSSEKKASSESKAHSEKVSQEKSTPDNDNGSGSGTAKEEQAGGVVATDSSKAKKTQSSSSSSESSDPKVNKLQSNQDLTSAQISSFNKQLAKGLAEDQQYADQGSDSYGWASSIDSVRYDKNRGLLVQASPIFSEANKRVKTVVAHNIQGDASIALAEINIDYTDPITVSFYDGNTKIGGSSMFNPATMKWK